MADNNRLAGTAILSVNGQTYELQGKLTYRVATVQRTSLESQSGTTGFKEMPIPGRITGTIRDAGGLSVADFNGMRNATVTSQLANGKWVTGRNMWTVEPEEVDTEEGTFPVAWEGPTGCVEEELA